MQKDTELHPVRFFKKRTVLGRRQRLPTDVAQQDYAVKFQRVDGTVELVECSVRCIHRNRCKALESFRMSSDEFGVGIVHHLRDRRLVFGVSEEDVRRRERNNLHIYPYAIHIFDTFGDISHRRRDAKKSRATMSDYRLTAGTGAERKLRRQIANCSKEFLSIKVRMQIKLHFVPFCGYKIFTISNCLRPISNPHAL